MIDITTIGDVNIDVLTQPIKALPKKDKQKLLNKIYMTVGGGAANFSLQISKLGLKTREVGLVGKDVYGNFIKNELERNGIDCCLKFTEKESTGISVGIEFVDGTKILLTYRGTNKIFSLRDFSLSKIRGKVLYLAGYNLLENLQKDMHKIISYGKKKHMLICLDPDLKSGKNFNEHEFFSLLKDINILFLNDYELRLLTGKNLKKSIDFLLKKGTNIVVVKLGSRGCIAASKNMRVKMKVPKIQPRTSTGAGDIFNAGFVYEYIKNYDLKSACMFGNSTAVCSLSRYGLKRYPSIKEISKMMKRYEKN